MDIEKIRTEVFQRTGKSIDPDDPFFVAVAMLSSVTEDMERKHTSLLSDLRKENSAWREMVPQIKGLIGALQEVKSKTAADEKLLDELRELIRRAYNQEREATRWLTRAHKTMDSLFWTLIGVSVAGGFIGGAIAAFSGRYF